MARMSKLTYKGVTYDIYDASAVHGQYSLPKATYNVLGGVMPLYSNTSAVTGVTASSGAKTVAVNAISTTAGKYYAVEIDANGRLYVNVPWTDNNTNYTYSISGAIDGTAGYKVTLTGANGGSSSNTTVPVMTAASTSAAGKMGLVPAPGAGANTKFLRGDGTWQTITDNNYTYSLSGAANSTGYTVTLTGANGGSTTSATLGIFSADGMGLVPKTNSSYASDRGYFLNAFGDWIHVPNIYYVEDESNHGTVESGAGNWTATFPKEDTIQLNKFTIVAGNSIPAAANPLLSAITAGDFVITTGGFIGVVKSVSGPTIASDTVTVIFKGRLSFMAYNEPTKYDASTETLILGSY